MASGNISVLSWAKNTIIIIKLNYIYNFVAAQILPACVAAVVDHVKLYAVRIRRSVALSLGSIRDSHIIITEV